jgi:cysteine sulfinate desulfinase/cysteine desulfurase-like protein
MWRRLPDGRGGQFVTRDLNVEQARQAGLRDRLWEGIRALFPGAILNGSVSARLANTLNVGFPGVEGDTLLINLDLAGICASSGAACMVGSIEPSHVLLAMGVDPAIARGACVFAWQTNHSNKSNWPSRWKKFSPACSLPRDDAARLLCQADHVHRVCVSGCARP